MNWIWIEPPVTETGLIDGSERSTCLSHDIEICKHRAAPTSRPRQSIATYDLLRLGRKFRSRFRVSFFWRRNLSASCLNLAR